MMTIRNRLLLILLPLLIGFVTLLSTFFYYYWSKEIVAGFKAHLASTVTTTASLIPLDDVSWIRQNIEEKKTSKEIVNQPRFKAIEKQLNSVIDKTSIDNLYIVEIEPVAIGETVLQNSPESELNPIFDGEDKAFAYRQVYLINASRENQKKSESLLLPGYQDFSESGESSLYFTKKAFVTPIYTARGSNIRFLTAYAPIQNAKGHVIALVAGDANLAFIDKKLHQALIIILLSASLAIASLILSVFFAANHMSRPVEQLKNAALKLAAGQYEENIQVNGPIETVDLANTLNTMRECLQDHLNHFKENALVRERMYGEYECSLLLQYEMLDKIVAENDCQHLLMKTVKAPSPTDIHGVLLKTAKEYDGSFSLIFKEAIDKGFLGIYELLNESAHRCPSLELSFSNDFKTMSYKRSQMHAPIVWSTLNKRFDTEENGLFKLEQDDLVFLFSHGLFAYFEHPKAIHEWFGKVLRHFGSQGFDLLVRMINNELHFLTKKRHIDRDVHILCLQIRN